MFVKGVKIKATDELKLKDSSVGVPPPLLPGPKEIQIILKGATTLHIVVRKIVSALTNLSYIQSIDY